MIQPRWGCVCFEEHYSIGFTYGYFCVTAPQSGQVVTKLITSGAYKLWSFTKEGHLLQLYDRVLKNMNNI